MINENATIFEKYSKPALLKEHAFETQILRYSDQGDETEIRIEVEYNYFKASRGHHDRYGAPEEPDTPAEIEIVSAINLETGQPIELTSQEEEKIEAELWDHNQFDNNGRFDEKTTFTKALVKMAKLINESIQNKSSGKTLAQVNAEISNIFRKYDIEATPGGQAFWTSVDHVKNQNHADGKRLVQLAREWESAYSREGIIKPHLQLDVTAEAPFSECKFQQFDNIIYKGIKGYVKKVVEPIGKRTEPHYQVIIPAKNRNRNILVPEHELFKEKVESKEDVFKHLRTKEGEKAARNKAENESAEVHNRIKAKEKANDTAPTKDIVREMHENDEEQLKQELKTANKKFDNSRGAGDSVNNHLGRKELWFKIDELEKKIKGKKTTVQESLIVKNGPGETVVAAPAYYDYFSEKQAIHGFKNGAIFNFTDINEKGEWQKGTNMSGTIKNLREGTRVHIRFDRNRQVAEILV